jgi:hypothetical protein
MGQIDEVDLSVAGLLEALSGSGGGAECVVDFWGVEVGVEVLVVVETG